MRQVFLIIFTLLSLTIHAQDNFNIGINGGKVFGNAEEFSKLAFGFDANYLFDISEDFNVGPFIGFVHFLPEGAQEARSYVPIGGAIRFHSLDDNFYVGGDVGFAIGMSPAGDNGGVYLKPLLGYKITESFKINLFYSAVKKRLPTYSYVGLGLVFDFFGSNEYYAY
ncbi:hypothetical protein [Tenacibaculum sp. IB213877]|uniref:hypothetical protein n=1 Tax=Tenacibaculum sp. IB213877 TaxID=3097351 RepID=UPI002A5A1F94|nr:hypothetical protein [Tenacibaculum sp. IB213877]MDY0779618.1 hypothetical protein [Tenacibaculum sp. IB213877]